ncbi:formyltransferase family protein [Polynucleobacter sp. AP-Feld-500C-C5]|uniref:formyltransferase family protein n=1 Tax=Polynucleobacter sp. AP-Feld-500C-C5 TaxID=2576924 RepID=UPI001C0E8845|nr:formyltransferase family protein [Polynucleobacter sp. AP-Feld-500C-C5]MBU3632874.1 hypothetical protein [Polynucleobacter sp. AP-Feld-500C-C5]
MNKKVYLFSYEVPHVKTIDLAKKLIFKGYSVTVMGFPFKRKFKNKIETFEERPHQLLEGDLYSTCKEIGADLIKISSWEMNDTLNSLPKNTNDTIYITCISKIIPKEIIDGRIILNAHPGLLPENRGLDAFKWSIIKAMGVGVTVHAINHEIDAGIILARVRTPILEGDTLFDVAARNYQLENFMLENFELYIDNLHSKTKVDVDKYSLSKNLIANIDLENINNIFIDQKKNLIKISKLKVISLVDYEFETFFN